MSESKLDDILTRIQLLQDELEDELENVLKEKRESFQYTFERGKVSFEKKIRSLQRQHKKNLLKYFNEAKIRHIITSPIIYSVIVPLVFLDIMVTIYQHVCFRAYGIPLVKRSKYLMIDRQHLAYLNAIEKLNCMYCGYGNGLISYIREIIARTEQYWCPIKHATKIVDGHRLTENYVDYGDAEAYRKKLDSLRNNIRFLIDGQQFYPSMLNAIEHSSHYLMMEMYLFESGQIADQFIKAFSDASKRGVNVILLIDAYGSLGLSKADKYKLSQSNVQLVFYNPIRFIKFKNNLFRTHRKYLIIDGKSAYIGGAGLTDAFSGENAWRETVVKVEGNVVNDWQTLFLSVVTQYLDENNLKDLITFPFIASTHKNNNVKARLAYTSGGTKLEIKKVLLNKINNSQQSVWLASAYFIPSRKLRKALRMAAQNGIDVRLLLPGPITDHPAVRYASRRYYARLLRFGVRIFEYQGRFTHTKMVLVDDWFSIGSSNMDRWNFRWNLEANLEVHNSPDG
ncbi:Cardiolipin synthase [Nymphon striatum]|nr:Cardiolipin synthase [Nymphon striatum]